MNNFSKKNDATEWAEEGFGCESAKFSGGVQDGVHRKITQQFL